MKSTKRLHMCLPAKAVWRDFLCAYADNNICFKIMVMFFGVLYVSSPQTFWHKGPVSWKAIFPQSRVGEGGMVSG